VKFSPDGSRLYASGFGPTVVLDTASGKELHRIPGTGILAVSPDGRRIAVRDGSRAMRIVDSSGRAAPITVSLSSFPTAADFSPNGTQLAIAAGNDVVVASTATGEIAETLRDHDGLVTAVEFRPTGELVTAGADGAIVTSALGDWSAAFRSERHLRDHAPAELDERTVALEQSDGRWQVVVAEPAV
jgi:WD40 repeat protein